MGEVAAYVGDKWEGSVGIDVEHRPCTVWLIDPDGERTRLKQKSPGQFSAEGGVVLAKPGRYSIKVEQGDTPIGMSSLLEVR